MMMRSLAAVNSRLSLSSRNRAIADYLRSNGYEEAYSTFKKEAELDMVRRGDICLLKGVLSVSYCLSFPPLILE